MTHAPAAADDVPDALERSIRGYQKLMCDALLQAMGTRLVLPEVVSHLSAATDFRLMPLEQTEEANTALLTWGDDSVEWLCNNVLTHLEPAIVQSELLQVKLFVREHRSEWELEHDVYDEDGNVVGQEKRLTLVGEGSIAHTLFTQPDRIPGGVPKHFLELMDYMISFRYNRTSSAVRSARAPSAC